MPIRWSSTYVMIDCAEKKKKYVDTFVYELGLRQTIQDDKNYNRAVIAQTTRD
ncbi:hypothetical protein PAXRUDRAFT_22911 [Paxillus rubicundulus Ve08.2h10]|uniref:Uncharacterized protein n=1 Tax=Paxillus rubicundulus Ve08.2h10 TaxID=930991 RepID=A0A0D0CME5_9AGAM|nr:hypothetical protein PAXRUDRAFT_22911 [Paxillus rubicundulus Ve08.2h10]